MNLYVEVLEVAVEMVRSVHKMILVGAGFVLVEASVEGEEPKYHKQLVLYRSMS